MSALSYIAKEYREALLPYSISAALFSAMPWFSGPYWLDFVAILIWSYVFLTLWVFIVRPIYLSLVRRNKQK